MRFGTGSPHTTRAVRVWLFLLRQDVKLARLMVRRLGHRNMQSEDRVNSPGGPIVSVTSHGKRIESAYLSLESITAGSVLPSRLILWLDDKKALGKLPSSLVRLKERGLEVRASEDFGPHTKYYPYLLSEDRHDGPLVIADDDVLYSQWWLSGLVNAYGQDSESISCYRAHVVRFANRALQPYATWKSCQSTQPSFAHFATGVSGCILPGQFLQGLKLAGPEFLRVCPKADDIWLHANALRLGLKTRQIFHAPLNFPFLPGSQETGLYRTNVDLAENDEQIRSTYSVADLDRLIASEEREGAHSNVDELIESDSRQLHR